MNKQKTWDPCYTCRRRRIQCDQSGIPCAKCEQGGIECLEKRPFRWVKGVAIRGRLQGVSIDDAKRKKASKQSAVQKYVGRTAENVDGELDGSATLTMGLDPPFLSNIDRSSRLYLDYYNVQICKLFIVLDSEKNPFRNLIPLALNDSTLFKAVLALAARHKANTGHPFHQPGAIPASTDENRDALFYKHGAMKGLSHALTDIYLCRQDTTIASVFLMIFLDLLESGQDRWNFHLEGAKSLLRLIQPSSEGATCDQTPGRTIEEIRSFITRQIYVIETLGGTFVRPKLLSQFILQTQPETLCQETVEQSFLGCPEYLLHAIQSLSIQRDTIASIGQLNSDSIDHIQNLTNLLDSIQQFDSYVWASSMRSLNQPCNQDTSRLCTLSQAYKTGAVIYGQRVLDAFTNTTVSQDDLLLELIGYIDALKMEDTLLKCALWPILVASLECRCQGQKEFLLRCLERFWQDTKCVNVINAAKILETYWQQQSQESPSQWIFTIGRLGGDWLLI